MIDHNLGTRIMHAAERDAVEGLAVAAEEVLKQAREGIGHGDPETDPHLGALAASGKVVPVETPFGKGFKVEFESEYAAVQEFAHYKHPRGGGAHFIQRGLTSVMPKMNTIVSTRITGRAD